MNKNYFLPEQAHNFLKKRALRKNVRYRHFEFNEGDTVLVKALNVSDVAERRIAKFFHVYEEPYIIKEKIGPDTYMLIDLETNRERGKFHVHNLKPYYK